MRRAKKSGKRENEKEEERRRRWEGGKMSSRRGAGRLNSRAKGALSALEAAQKGGRTKTFKLNKEEDVYDVVGEEDYGKIVHKRREEYGACMRTYV